MTPDSPLTHAKARHLAGDLPAARTSYETALAEEPDNADIRLRRIRPCAARGSPPCRQARAGPEHPPDRLHGRPGTANRVRFARVERIAG